jgi:hypothetical protein
MISDHDLDPLDREFIERAFEGAWASIKSREATSDYESDEELEAALRVELIDLARDNGLNDAETPRDLVLTMLPRERTRR